MKKQKTQKQTIIFPCKDCENETFRSEYYMVYDLVWEIAHKEKESRDGFLCIGCLEKRIGRQLIANDFIDYPVNSLSFSIKSDRLMNRLGYVGLDTDYVI